MKTSTAVQHGSYENEERGRWMASFDAAVTDLLISMSLTLKFVLPLALTLDAHKTCFDQQNVMAGKTHGAVTLAAQTVVAQPSDM